MISEQTRMELKEEMVFKKMPRGPTLSKSPHQDPIPIEDEICLKLSHNSREK